MSVSLGLTEAGTLAISGVVVTVFAAFVVVALSALVDILYAALDPRIRLSS